LGESLGGAAILAAFWGRRHPGGILGAPPGWRHPGGAAILAAFWGAAILAASESREYFEECFIEAGWKPAVPGWRPAVPG